MKAKLPPLGFLVAGMVSAALAQQSPPAPLPTGLQQLLNVPVWYFNYTVVVSLAGNVANGHERRERVTTGRMMLGIRSSGPSLSAIANPALMQITTPDQIDALVANYANWIHGPPPEDESLPAAQQRTPAQQDAYFEQVRTDNMKAFHRHRYDYAAGGTERTSASGSGPVLHAHEPALEFDAVNRRYRLLFAPLNFVDSAATLESFRGVREAGIGSINYVRQEIKTGILTGDDRITGLQPALGIFEGPLPGSLGNVAFTSVHQVTGPRVRGTVSVQVTLSPYPPEPVEMFIEPPANYSIWMPLGANDEKTAGDRVPITVVVQKPGGGVPRFKPVRFSYLLTGTSREKGVCLNWPAQPEPTTPFDFQFEDNANPGLSIVGTDRQAAVEVLAVPGRLTGTVTVSSFDYGAYGELEAYAVLENGQVVHGIVRNTADQRQLKLPLRKDGSLIALAFLENLSHLPDDDDSENDPVGDRFTGDGLTLYEEYRGFMHGNEWMPGDPKKKDVFVVNELRSIGSVSLGVKYFENATGLNVHSLLRRNQVDADGMINFHRTSGPHVVDQHAIRIKRNFLISQGAGSARVSAVGTPGTAKWLLVPPDLGVVGGVMYMGITVAHEMLHCVNVYHHGERDQPPVWWYYEPNVSPGNQMYESVDEPTPRTLPPVQIRTHITIKEESGTVVPPSVFFPSGIVKGQFQLGEMHGQHSGVDNCLMRYDTAFAYASISDPRVRYLTGGESTGMALCNLSAGTGVNGNRSPQSRYGPAATPQNGGPSVQANRGACEHQVRVSDLATEPKR